MILKSALALAIALQLSPSDGLEPDAEDSARPPTKVLVADVVYVGSAAQLDVDPPRYPSAEIRIDGILDDDAWSRAATLTGFTQYEPIEGIAASEETTVRVLFTDDALYFAVRAEDSRGGVRATLSERDGFGRSDDYVRFIVDTFNDRRRAYVFTVNPLGIQGDGLWVEGGRGRFGDPIDWNPDFLWESRGRVDDRGYSVEVRVPIKTLRFPELDVQDWGLQVTRRIQRTGYQESWAPITSDRANRLEQAGTLRGLKGLDPGLFMEVNPTATASLQGAYDADLGSLTRRPTQSDFGLNLTYGLTSNLTLDATVNPDFSQIEADAGQITVNERFALYLQEKRPFFLEGTDVFSMPQQLVYTRSIVNPVGAAKLSGKVGSFRVAYLGAVDETNAGSDNPIVNLVRVKGDFGRSSSVGLVYTDRTTPGASSNRVVGADGRLILGGRYTLTMMAAASADGVAGGSNAWGSLVSASLSRSGRDFSANASFEDVTEDFRARSGFIRRTGVTQLRGRTEYTWRGRRGAFLESWGPFAEANAYWARDDFWAGGSPQERELSVGFRASLRNNIGGFLSYQRSGFDFAPDAYAPFFAGTDALMPVSRGVMTGLDQVRLRSWISRWERARLSLGASWGETPIFARGVPIDRGDEWSGDVGVTFYPTQSLQAELGVRHVSIARSRDGSTYSSATIPRVQARYQLSRALFVRAISEYASQERGDVLDPVTGTAVSVCRDGSCSLQRGSDRHDFRVEGLLGYEPSPGTVFYLGYTRQFEDTFGFRFQDVRTQADGLFAKLSYRFRL